MGKSLISEGSTTEEAIEKGLKELKLTKRDVDIKVLEEKKKSFFSILEPRHVKVEITPKEEKIIKISEEKKIEDISEENKGKEVEILNNLLKEILPKISTEITYEIKKDNDEFINVDIKGNGSSKLIGYRGEALNSFEYVVNKIIKNKTDSMMKVLIDVENYKEKRKDVLEELALKLEKTVIRTGKKITLEPMNAYERRIIHLKLEPSQYVQTYSIGTNENRRIVIEKK